LILAAVFVFLLWGGQALADEESRSVQKSTRNPAIIELFTTQGCGDAPVADRIVEKILEENPEAIVLSCHVTYYDKGDWPDSLSREFCNERQKGYFRGQKLERLYIPQLLINGRFETSGAYENIVRSGAKMASAEKLAMPIHMSLRGQTLDLEFPQLDLDTSSVDVWLFSYKAQERVDIKGGGNAGLVVNYVNIAHRLEKLESWDGRALKVSVPVNMFETDGYAVIAQHENYGPIVAAGRVERPGLVRKSVSTEPSIPFSRPISMSE
ncbi:MAG: DUF1223 domain-containing protein, partial [Alphaproteobacteria bacterium]